MDLKYSAGTEEDVQARLFKHRLKYKDGDVFYHYCSNETLRAICESKTLRFSDVNMMNDHAEMRHGYEVFEKAAGRLIDLGFEKAFFDDVDRIISPMAAHVHPVLCSFSKKPDVLSQWRAYGDDGKGVAIGFSSDCFATMPVSLVNVEYDEEKQVSEMVDILGALYEVEALSGNTRGAEFRGKCAEVAMYKIAFKNAGFYEEQEVRCLHLLNVVANGKGVKLVDKGGYSAGKKVKGQEVKYRTENAGLIAYVDIPFRLHQVAEPIKEIWCGPKNPNLDGNFLYMLTTFGITGFSIHRSKATYR